jgi:phosphopantetheinyl transferase (holo-ACP synthase)
VNWTGIDALSKAGVNWTGIDAMSRGGMNWTGIDALSTAGVNWTGIEALSRGGMNWTDVEILNHASGQPYVTLYGRAAPLAGTGTVHISLTHTATQAAAIAIFVDGR